MKKYAIIGLVFAALTLGSCKDDKGGTIKVVNNCTELGQSVGGLVTITNIIPLKMETIPAGETKEFAFDEDGTYTITSVPGTASPSKVSLSGGNTETVTIR